MSWARSVGWLGVAASCLGGSASGQVAGLQVSTPFPIDVRSSRPAVALDVATAWDGMEFVSGAYVPGLGVVGVRVTPSGISEDPLGFSVSSDASAGPAVAGGAMEALFAWPSSDGSSLLAARWSASGASVVDQSPIALSLGAAYPVAGRPAAAFDGTNYVVVWRQQLSLGNPQQLNAVLVPGTGAPTVLKAQIDAGSPISDPAIVYDERAGRYVVAWVEPGSNATWVTTLGTANLLPTPPINVLPAVAAPALCRAPSADAELVTEIDPSTGGLEGVVLTADGGVPFVQVTGTANDSVPTVLFDGNEFDILWGFDAVDGLSVRTDGSVSEGVTSVLTTSAQSLSLASTVNETLLTWVDGSSQAARASVLGTGLSLADPAGHPLLMRLAAQEQPSASSDGTNFLSVWADDRNGPTEIFGAFHSASLATTTADFQISSGFGSGESSPSVAWASGVGDYLAVFQNASNIVNGRQVFSDGTVATADTPISSNGVLPTVVWNGDAFVVAWQTPDGATPGIAAARVSSNGDVIDTTPLTLLATNPATHAVGAPAAATLGSVTLVTWLDSTGSLRASRVFADGGYDATPFQLTPLDTTLHDPAATSDGTNWVLVSNDDAGVVAQRVAPDGTNLDPVPLVLSQPPAGEQDGPPTIAFDGHELVAAWLHLSSTLTELRAREVLFDGGLPASVGVAAATPGDQAVMLGRLAVGPPGTFLATFVNPADDGGVILTPVDRAVGALITFGLPVPADAGAVDSGAGPDAGPQGPLVASLGCNCRSAEGAGVAWLVVLLVGTSLFSRRLAKI